MLFAVLKKMDRIIYKNDILQTDVKTFFFLFKEMLKDGTPKLSPGVWGGPQPRSC